MTRPGRRLEFDATIEEAVDVTMRSMHASTANRVVLRRGASIAGTVAASAVIVIPLLAARHVSPKSAWLVVVLGIAAGAALFLSWPAMVRSSMKKRLRRVYSELTGGRDTFRCEIELRPDGFWTRQHDVETLTPWSKLVVVAEIEDGIELRFATTLVVARNRAFATPADRRAFLDEVRGRAASHRA
jgi:hypothetical protein